MKNASQLHARRDVLRFSGGIFGVFAASRLLMAGEGEGGSVISDSVAVVTGSGRARLVTSSTTSAKAVDLPSGVCRMNLGLTLQYVGAQFYAMATQGFALASTMQGVGEGAVRGGRQVAFTDSDLARAAAEIAADKAARIADLRTSLGTSAAAPPTVDFSPSAFGVLGQALGKGASFDPFADDESFLIGALALEYGVAGAFRSMLNDEVMTSAEGVLTTAMGDAEYHSGLIQSLVAIRAESDPTFSGRLNAVYAALGTRDQTTATNAADYPGQTSSTVSDAHGYPMPLTRSASQTQQMLNLSVSGTASGFVPADANGMQIQA